MEIKETVFGEYWQYLCAGQLPSIGGSWIDKEVVASEFVDFRFKKRVCSKSAPYGAFNPFPNKPWFLRVCSITLLKTLWEKEKLLVTSNFSFSHNVFYPFRELSAIFVKFKIVVCKLFQFGRV